MTYLPALPQTATWREVVARFPQPLDKLVPFTHALLYGPSQFTLGERELIAAFVSVLNRCGYCVRSHLPAARAHGIAASRLAAVENGIEGLSEADSLRPVLLYVRKLTLGPASITQADVDAILACGWSEEAVLHAACLAGYWSMVNRIVEGLGIAADAAYFARIGSQLMREAQAIQADLSEKKDNAS
jgi:uncharacterized peroxidase-related enzyme